MLPAHQSKPRSAFVIESNHALRKEVGSENKEASSLKLDDTADDDFASSLQGLWTETYVVTMPAAAESFVHCHFA